MHTNNFLFQISGGTFDVVLDFPCALFAKHYYFPNSEYRNPKVWSEKILLFSEKKHFQIWYSRSSLKKKSQKKFTIFFSVHQNYKTNKFAISKISDKNFRKIHYFANIKYKRNSWKYCEKNLRRNIFVKRKIFAKKNSIKEIVTK